LTRSVSGRDVGEGGVRSTRERGLEWSRRGARGPACPALRLRRSGLPETRGDHPSAQAPNDVRLLLVIVALAALAPQAGLTGWRAVSYRKRAADHARYLRAGRSWIYDSSELRGWQDRMRRKYDRAPSRPW